MDWLYHLRRLIVGYGECTVTYQLIFVFGISFLFGPFSMGLLYYILFIIFWEILFYYLCSEWNFIDRALIAISGLLGWFISRMIFLDDYKISNWHVYKLV
jgi:hypothetical protein